MKSFYLILSFLFITLSLRAQTFTGRVLDEARNAVPGATVVLLSWPDSTLLKGEVTDLDGRFSLIVPEKTTATSARLRIHGVNVMPRMVPISIQDGDKDFGDMVLPAKTTEVGEVVVSGIRNIFVADPEKLTFNVAQAIATQGLTALEVLRKSPGVYVDRDDKIILKGKPGPRIYINGRPSPLNGKDLANYLNAMQASDIEAIELISNPGARYEAQSSGGIINIRLKQNKQLGFSGTAGFVLAQGTYTAQEGYYLPRFNLNASLNYRKGGFGASGSITHYEVRNLNFQRHWRQSRASDTGDVYVNLPDSSTNPPGVKRILSRVDTVYEPIPAVTNNMLKGTFGQFSLDYAFNKRHSIGFNFNGNYQSMDWRTLSRTQIRPVLGGITQASVRTLEANSVIDEKNMNGTGGLWYRFQDSSGHVLEADLSTSLFKTDKVNDVPNEYKQPESGSTLYDVIFRMVQPSHFNLSVAKVDYTTPLLTGTLSVGGRANLVNTDNTFDYFRDANPVNGLGNVQFELDPQLSNRFLYTERVAGGYFTYTIGYKKFKFNAGLRSEYTYTKRDLRTEAIVSKAKVGYRKYVNWFPSAGVSWTLNQNHILTLNFTSHIDRPNYGQLSPFENKLDELAYQRGNPDLMPQLSYNMELSHTAMGMINTSLGYTRINDMFSEQIGTDPTGRRNFIEPSNLATRDQFSLNLATPFQITKWWSGFFGANGYYDIYNGMARNQKVYIEMFSCQANGQSTWRLGKGYTFETSGYYNSPNVWAGTFRNARFWGVDVGLRRRMMNNKITLALTCSDIFRSNRWRGISDYGLTRVESSGGWDSRIVRFSFTYAFGNSKIKAQRRQSAIDELKNRAGGGGGR